VALMRISLLLGCVVAIYLACEWFVNAVEWLGVRLKMGTLAIGSVLAAIGTALRESVATLVAVMLGHSAQSQQIGVGTAMGGPLVLAAIADGVTGWMLRTRKRTLVPQIGGSDPSRSGCAPRSKHRRGPPSREWTCTAWPATRDGSYPSSRSRSPWGSLPSRSSRGWVWRSSPPTACISREIRADTEAHTDADLEPLKLQPKAAAVSGWAVAA
jgi:cation:H+ antiporter